MSVCQESIMWCTRPSEVPQKYRNKWVRIHSFQCPVCGARTDRNKMTKTKAEIHKGRVKTPICKNDTIHLEMTNKKSGKFMISEDLYLFRYDHNGVIRF